jgi:integrase
MVGHPAFDLRGTANAVGKRFGRLKRRVLADGDSRQKCFHSIRKFVVTTLEQANVPEGIAADLVGHEKPNITYNVYSGGSSIEQLQTAVRVLEAAQVDT